MTRNEEAARIEDEGRRGREQGEEVDLQIDVMVAVVVVEED